MVNDYHIFGWRKCPDRRGTVSVQLDGLYRLVWVIDCRDYALVAAEEHLPAGTVKIIVGHLDRAISLSNILLAYFRSFGARVEFGRTWDYVVVFEVRTHWLW